MASSVYSKPPRHIISHVSSVQLSISLDNVPINMNKSSSDKYMRYDDRFLYKKTFKSVQIN